MIGIIHTIRMFIIITHEMDHIHHQMIIEEFILRDVRVGKNTQLYQMSIRLGF